MKHRFSKIGLTVVVLLALSFCVMLTAFRSESSSAEIDEITAALIGALETQGRMGYFKSVDGLTSSLTDAEIKDLMAQYNEQVDLYYAEGNSCRTFYKWLYKDYLTRSLKTNVENCVDAGVSRCDISSIRLDKGGTKAYVSAEVTLWNKFVEQKEGATGYSVVNPVDRLLLEVTMIKEDGTWKLLATDTDIVLASGYDDYLMNDKNNLLESCLQRAAMSDTKEKEILSEIAHSKEILSRTYDTYQDALNALDEIDIENGNYFALFR